MRTTKLFTILLLCFSVTRIALAQDEKKTTDFTEIVGKVVDSSNKPIEKFSVRILVYDYTEGGWQETPKTIAKWDKEFEDGEFKFEVKEPIKINDMTYVSRTITAAGYLEQNRNGGFIQLKRFSGKLGTTKLARGVKIKGKVKLPDGHADEKPIQTKVFVSKVMTSVTPDWNNMFQATCTVSEDGTFEKTVPENCKIMVTCSADNAATSSHNFKIAKSKSMEDEQDLGELKLKKGVAVSGVVVNRDGEPVAGQVIKMQQNIMNQSYVSSFVYGYAVSDEEGKFTLPPREGSSEISLVESGQIDGKEVKVKGKLLTVKPVSLTIKEGKPPAELRIEEAPAHKVYGTIQFEGTNPTVYFSYGQSNQTQFKVDDDGTFEFEVVEGVTPWLIIQQRAASEVMVARMDSESRKEFGKYFSSAISEDTYYFQFKKIKTEIGPLNFRMIRQFYDDRSMVDRLVDWYYYGDD